MPKLGLIAGNRAFPIHVARAAKALGYEVVAVGLREETDPALEGEVDQMHWVSLAQVGQVPELFKQAGVQELLLAGQVKPERLLQGGDRFDGVVRQLLRFLPDRSGTSAMKMAVQYLQSLGFRVLDSGTFLKEWIPRAGVLTRRAPDPGEREDIEYGIPLARQLAHWGIGQTLVVRHKAVVAVEALEGTDATVQRAGQVAGQGCVMVKACEAGHDMRFDIPVVGVETIQVMQEARAGALGVEAGRCLFFNLPEMVSAADAAGIAILAV